MYIYVIYLIMKTMCPPGYHHNGFWQPCTWAPHDVPLIYIYIYILNDRTEN